MARNSTSPMANTKSNPQKQKLKPRDRNYKPKNPKLRKNFPEKPKEISARASELWDEFIEDIIDEHYIIKFDKGVFASHCEAIAEFEKLNKWYNDVGGIDKMKLRKNEVDECMDLDEYKKFSASRHNIISTILKTAKALGFDPWSRSKIDIKQGDKKKTEEEELDDLLGPIGIAK